MSKIFTPTLHPRIALRKKLGPVKVSDLMTKGAGGPITRFNSWLAVKVTNGVGIVSWISQTFLQLVLLSIIIVGQNVLAAASDKRAEATYEDADAVLHTALQIQDHLAAQDAEIEKILGTMASLKAT